MLKPSGTLIEIHPALEVPTVIVESAGAVSFEEDDPGFDYTEDLRMADEAVAAVVDRGLFRFEVDRRFEHRTHAASVTELRDHWAVAGAYDAEEKEADVLRRRDEMYARAAAALDASSGVAEVIYVEPATMSRLTPSR
ncbi:MAG: hypothetical protein ACR2L4_10825 [Actinomycetota bacterium]